MAAAREEAHQTLVRDFKPGNVKIKPDRTMKVLDFSLAKLPAMQTGAGAPTRPHSPWRLHRRECSWVRRRICLPSRPEASLWTSAAMCGRMAKISELMSYGSLNR